MNHNPRQPLGILGGTFDPPHFGHLRPALELLEGLDMHAMRFIPCHVPPHRPQPEANAIHRLAMLQAAVADEAKFIVDEQELQRPGPSYTVDTLRSLREEYPDTPLCLCLGLDAFLQLHTWHDWQRITEQAHVVVSHRPGWVLNEAEMDETLRDWLRTHRAEQPAALQHSLAGRVWLQQVTPLTISATAIRAHIAAGHSARYLLPEPVWRYIQHHKLYTK